MDSGDFSLNGSGGYSQYTQSSYPHVNSDDEFSDSEGDELRQRRTPSHNYYHRTATKTADSDRYATRIPRGQHFQHSDWQRSQRLRQTQSQVDEVVDIMRVNVDHVLERGQRLQELDQRAHELGQYSYELNEWQSGESRRQSSWCSLCDYCIETIKTGFKKVFGSAEQSSSYRPTDPEEYQSYRSSHPEEYPSYRSSYQEESSSNRPVLRSLCDYSIRAAKATTVFIAFPLTLAGIGSVYGFFNGLEVAEKTYKKLEKREVCTACNVAASVVAGIGGGIGYGIYGTLVVGSKFEGHLIKTALKGGSVTEEIKKLWR
ncbi:hypothetical protein [Endozoicomonas sp.]|uniref:hypothetical protein n=1 Tax=Endozoicomonas sp. TaxID=1892382 RepID=UPI003AF85D8D